MMDDSDDKQNKIHNVDEFCKNSLGAIMKIVQSSHGLPKAGDDHEFYSSFSGFQEFLSYQKDRLIKFISLLMRNNGFLVSYFHHFIFCYKMFNKQGWGARAFVMYQC